PMAKDNRSIGQFILDGIPPAPRGVPQIEVTFDIDANGILSVSSKDKGTGKEQSIRIEASTGLSQEEIDKMKAEAQANSDADKAAKEKAEKLNAADQLVFQTEKQLSEYGDKLPEEKKTAIEEAAAKLKEAHKSQDIDAIDSAMETLNTAWQAASQEMYQATQEGAQANGGDASAEADQSDSGTNEEEVTDVEFEEVDDK
ncbi:MAG: Hsp70 family protein, partial [Bacteroidia bacterium]|nr:Hsp70 family protein [Bacteroidia bacterium]